MNNTQYILDDKKIDIIIESTLANLFLENAYIDENVLTLMLNDERLFLIPLSAITEETSIRNIIEAINNTEVRVIDENEKIYDKSILDMNFSTDGGNLMITSEVDGLIFAVIREEKEGEE